MNKLVTNKHIPLWWLLSVSALAISFNTPLKANTTEPCSISASQANNEIETQQALTELMHKTNGYILQIKESFDGFFNDFKLTYAQCLDRMHKVIRAMRIEVKAPLQEISKIDPSCANAHRTISQICDIVDEIVKTVEEYGPAKKSQLPAMIAAAALGQSLKSGKDKLKNAVIKNAIPHLREIEQKTNHGALAKIVSSVVTTLESLVKLDKSDINETLKKLCRRIQH